MPAKSKLAHGTNNAEAQKENNLCELLPVECPVMADKTNSFSCTTAAPCIDMVAYACWSVYHRLLHGVGPVTTDHAHNMNSFTYTKQNPTTTIVQKFHWPCLHPETVKHTCSSHHMLHSALGAVTRRWGATQQSLLMVLDWQPAHELLLPLVYIVSIRKRIYIVSIPKRITAAVLPLCLYLSPTTTLL